VNDFVDAAGVARLGMAAHMRAITAPRQAETDLAAVEANRLHAEARDLAVAVPAFGPAFGAQNAGQSVVPLTADGAATLPDCEPTRDLSRLLGYWTEYPTAPAGLPTGPQHDLVAATFDSAGWSWLKTNSLDGEPEGDRPARRLDPVFGLVRLIEQRAAVSPWQSTTFFGEKAMADAGNVLNSRTTLAVRDIAVWRYPIGWSLRTGRVARGTHLLPAVPADGAILDAGKTWRCQWAGGGIGRLVPMPEWVAETLDGKRTAA
jgi:hypothetical protein